MKIDLSNTEMGFILQCMEPQSGKLTDPSTVARCQVALAIVKKFDEAAKVQIAAEKDKSGK